MVDLVRIYLAPFARWVSTGVLAVAAVCSAVASPGDETLQGVKAVARLKEQGSYDSLVAAAAAAGYSSNSPATALWQQQRRLTSQTGAAVHDSFGWAVALSGNRAIVGATEDYAPQSGNHLGSAYIFLRTGSQWTQQAKLIPPNGASFARFGWSVAISGDVAVIGAPFGGDQRGVAYIYAFDNGQWNLQAQLTGVAANDRFGYSVGVSADAAIIGSYPVGAGRTQGFAYVSTRSGATWSAGVPLTATDQTAGTIFGFSVALSGNTAVVGAAGRDGAAHVFVQSGTTWSQQGPKLTRPGAVDNDFFGGSIALSGDTAIVQFENTLNVGGTRGAYFYIRASQAWSEQQHILEPRATSKLGRVGISGETAIVGISILARNNAAWSVPTPRISDRT